MRRADRGAPEAAAEAGKPERRRKAAAARAAAGQAAAACRPPRLARRSSAAGIDLRHAAAAAHAARHAHHAADLAEHALALAHRLHHVGHLAMHLEELVDLLDLGAGAGGDALLAARLEDVGVLALGRGHRGDDRGLALEDANRRCPSASICFFILPTPGSMPITPDMPPIFAIWPSCSARSSRSKTPFRIRSAAFCAFSASMFGGGLLDQADDVAHAEDAAGDALRVEVLERVELLAGAEQLDRLAGDGAHRERGAAAAVAVDAGEHDAGDADALVEGLARG